MLQPEARLGRYEINHVIGEAGTGHVYRATDTRRHRTVAIKVLRNADADHDAEAAWLRRLQRGSRYFPTLLARGKDPQAGRYVVMEWIEGESLDVMVQRSGPVSLARALRVTGQVFRALDELEHRGLFRRAIVHRNVTPANVLVDQWGRAHVIDFQLAAWTGVAVKGEGAPAYASPEQLLGGRLTPRSDVYSAAAMTYELLTGTRPFA